MWLYVLGPLVAFLPRRWRRALPFHDALHWHSAVILSGLAEFAAATYALVFWYSYCVTTWVSRMLDAALSKTAPTGITDHEVGFAALIIVVAHPLTWLIAFFILEGVVRLCAAFTDTVLGVFPLYVLDKVYVKLRGIAEPLPLGTPKFQRSHLSSYVESVREKIESTARTAVPDEHFVATRDSEEFLEIRSSHRKPDWDPPRTVRYEDRYYRLEESARGAAPRPFVYKLRRLPAGVPGRTVLIYQPEGIPVVAPR
jgi:hypothetical protein